MVSPRVAFRPRLLYISADMSMLGLEFDRILPFSPGDESRVLGGAPERPGVYVIRHCSFGFGQSGIVYVGRATGLRGLRGRLAGYFRPGPTQWTNQRVLARITALDGHDIALRAVSHPKLAELFEYRLLTEFKARFGRLPHDNKAMPIEPDLKGVRILAGGSLEATQSGEVLQGDVYGESSYVIDPSDICEVDEGGDEPAGCDLDALVEDDDEEDQDSELTNSDGDGAEVGLDEAEDTYQGYIRPDAGKDTDE